MVLKWCKLYQKVTYTHNIHIVKLLQLNSFSSENKTTCGFQIHCMCFSKNVKTLIFCLNLQTLVETATCLSFFIQTNDSQRKKRFNQMKKVWGWKEKDRKKKQKRIKIFDEVMQRKWNETLFSFNRNVLLFFVYFYFFTLFRSLLFWGVEKLFAQWRTN